MTRIHPTRHPMTKNIDNSADTNTNRRTFLAGVAAYRDGDPNEHVTTSDHNHNDDDARLSSDDPLELRMTPEGFRTVAALVRVEGLRRGVGPGERDATTLDALMAEDCRETPRAFDAAAREASGGGD